MDSDINMINLFKYCYRLGERSLDIVRVCILAGSLLAECWLFKVALLIRLAGTKGLLKGKRQFSYISIITGIFANRGTWTNSNYQIPICVSCSIAS